MSEKTAIAVDIGGTFTDLAVHHSDGTVTTTKALTTPHDLAEGVLTAFGQTDVAGESVEFFVHGTTAGLNALLERRFGTVGLITTRGFRDVYEIGRANRPAMYDLYYHRPEPLVARRHRLEVAERMNAQGEVVTPLDEQSLRAAADQLVAAGAKSIAVVLLHAYVNPAHELRCLELLREWYPEIAVSASHQVANEWREYERTSTTAMNAAVASTVDAYLSTLETRLAEAGVNTAVHVMQSNGGMTTAQRARVQAVNTLLSGPVGGSIAASTLASRAGYDRAIAVDMGGTSFDVSLCIDGEPQLAREAALEGQPLLLPVIDVQTVGAGGGSIAWNSVGGLRVGPQSAGAMPGPACYGRGGTEPTVTDANVFLDRVNADYFLGGEMQLHPEAAAAALATLGESLGLEPEHLANGILDIVNSRMAALIRQITVGRGLDPRDFALVAFGGAGPMHAVFLAEELGINTVLVPYSPGTLSAQGMLIAEIRRDVVRPYFNRKDELGLADLRATLAAMQEQGRRLLIEDGVAVDSAEYRFSIDIRYVGQEYFLTIPFTELDEATFDNFHTLYQRTFGHSSPDEPVETVNLRMQAVGQPLVQSSEQAFVDGEGKPYVYQEVGFRGRRWNTPRFRRQDLQAEQRIEGPLVIDEASCTSVVPDGWTVTVEADGLVRIDRETGVSK